MSCNQRFYLLKLLREQGMPLSCLNVVYRAIIVNRISYCAQAWGGFIKQTHIDKFNSLFRKAKRLGFSDSIYDFECLLGHLDSTLFEDITEPSHCLNHVLPPTKNHHDTLLRSIDHKYSYTLPRYRTTLYRKSFVMRNLYQSV